MVVTFHAQENMGMTRSQSPLFGYGQYGVDLFFVISGFIITVTTASRPSAITFFWKRVIRIVPLYWTVTLAYATVELLKPSLLRSAGGGFSHLAFSLLFIPAYHPKFTTDIWPTVIQGWSLNYEMLFYSIFGACLLAPARWVAFTAIAVLSLFVAIGQLAPMTNPIALTLTSTLLLEFSFGIVTGIVFLRSKASSTLLLSISFIAIASVCLLFELADFVVWRPLLWGSIFGFVLSLVLYFEQTGVQFARKLPIKIGDASYSIYLTHFAVIALLRMALGHLSLNVSQAWAPAWQLLAIASACSLGLLVHLRIEKPLTERLAAALNRHIRTSVSRQGTAAK